MKEHPASAAERFMRGVYCGDLSLVSELASEDILLSYPVFETMYGSPSIQGRRAVEDFVKTFSSRWAEAELTVHETITDGKKVVLVWSFRARNVGPMPKGGPATNQVHGWGGISFFRFDDSGKIEAEIGEESTPGPIGRVQPGQLP